VTGNKLVAEAVENSARLRTRLRTINDAFMKAVQRDRFEYMLVNLSAIKKIIAAFGILTKTAYQCSLILCNL
jgi:hypothetical protein